jgi:hypothetical protein
MHSIGIQLLLVASATDLKIHTLLHFHFNLSGPITCPFQLFMIDKTL